MTELLMYVSAIIVGSIICITIVLGCLGLLAKWEKESEELLKGDRE